MVKFGPPTIECGPMSDGSGQMWVEVGLTRATHIWSIPGWIWSKLLGLGPTPTDTGGRWVLTGALDGVGGAGLQPRVNSTDFSDLGHVG